METNPKKRPAESLSSPNKGESSSQNEKPTKKRRITHQKKVVESDTKSQEQSKNPQEIVAKTEETMKKEDVASKIEEIVKKDEEKVSDPQNQICQSSDPAPTSSSNTITATSETENKSSSSVTVPTGESLKKELKETEDSIFKAQQELTTLLEYFKTNCLVGRETFENHETKKQLLKDFHSAVDEALGKKPQIATDPQPQQPAVAVAPIFTTSSKFPDNFLALLAFLTEESSEELETLAKSIFSLFYADNIENENENKFVIGEPFPSLETIKITIKVLNGTETPNVIGKGNDKSITFWEAKKYASFFPKDLIKSTMKSKRDNRKEVLKQIKNKEKDIQKLISKKEKIQKKIENEDKKLEKEQKKKEKEQQKKEKEEKKVQPKKEKEEKEEKPEKKKEKKEKEVKEKEHDKPKNTLSMFLKMEVKQKKTCEIVEKIEEILDPAIIRNSSKFKNFDAENFTKILESSFEVQELKTQNLSKFKEHKKEFFQKLKSQEQSLIVVDDDQKEQKKKTREELFRERREKAFKFFKFHNDGNMASWTPPFSGYGCPPKRSLFSSVVTPRKPLLKDPQLDYVIDSEEEFLDEIENGNLNEEIMKEGGADILFGEDNLKEDKEDENEEKEEKEFMSGFIAKNNDYRMLNELNYNSEEDEDYKDGNDEGNDGEDEEMKENSSKNEEQIEFFVRDPKTKKFDEEFDQESELISIPNFSSVSKIWECLGNQLFPQTVTKKKKEKSTRKKEKEDKNPAVPSTDNEKNDKANQVDDKEKKENDESNKTYQNYPLQVLNDLKVLVTANSDQNKKVLVEKMIAQSPVKISKAKASELISSSFEKKTKKYGPKPQFLEFLEKLKKVDPSATIDVEKQKGDENLKKADPITTTNAVIDVEKAKEKEQPDPQPSKTPKSPSKILKSPTKTK